MSALRRPTTPRLTTSPACDQCGYLRATGNHRRCSRLRQAIYAQRAKEM